MVKSGDNLIEQLKENNIIEQLQEVGKINIDYIDYIDVDLERLIEVLEKNFCIKTEIQDLIGGRYLVNLGYKGD